MLFIPLLYSPWANYLSFKRPFLFRCFWCLSVFPFVFCRQLLLLFRLSFFTCSLYSALLIAHRILFWIPRRNLFAVIFLSVSISSFLWSVCILVSAGYKNVVVDTDTLSAPTNNTLRPVPMSELHCSNFVFFWHQIMRVLPRDARYFRGI